MENMFDILIYKALYVKFFELYLDYGKENRFLVTITSLLEMFVSLFFRFLHVYAMTSE